MAVAPREAGLADAGKVVDALRAGDAGPVLAADPRRDELVVPRDGSIRTAAAVRRHRRRQQRRQR